MRVVRLIIAGKKYAFLEAFEVAFVTVKSLRDALGIKLKIETYVDPCQLFMPY